MTYVINPTAAITYKGVDILTPQDVVNAINFTNDALLKLNKTTQEFDINIFETLGLRNLSGLVGEYFARSVMRFSNGKLQSNLHQDGYPDLCLTDTPTKKNYFDSLYTVKGEKKYPINKEVFSPYEYGGIEIKATCGSTPSASIKPKPLVGEQRVSMTDKFDWKAHHRETNHLLAVLWDFIDSNPTIVAAFYRDDLTVDDWGKIVQPKEDGGRTTSVSVMNTKGIKKMCLGWVAVLDDQKYIDLLSKKKWIGYKVK